MNLPRRKTLGDSGEAHARAWLEARGYRFVAAQWRCLAGELDVVMVDGAELVFVEVKTRRGESAGRAEEAITPTKGRRLLAAGSWFVADHPEWHDVVWRIDLVAITLDARGGVARVAHLINAVVE
ncbi:MAG: YraN family protein [Thermomicrobiales bacterium]|nr:YraN family protein [Thermomicrobiales bacterium]